MGIVIKQSAISTALTYTGVAIGYINILILFPKYMSPAEIGLARLVQDTVPDNVGEHDSGELAEAIRQFSNRLCDGVTGMRSGFKIVLDPHLTMALSRSVLTMDRLGQ